MTGIAVITGASRGIGAACARKAAAAGWDVALGYLANADLAEDVANSVRAEGRRALAVQAVMGGA